MSPEKATTRTPKTTPAARQLAAVVVDVGERRHDQDRLRVEGGAVGAQHEAGLLGVGGTGDERERHGVPTGLLMVRRSGRLHRVAAETGR